MPASDLEKGVRSCLPELRPTRRTPVRVTLVSEHASPLAAIGGVDSGGQNVHVAALAASLAERGHEVVVHTRRSRSDQPLSVVMAPGVTVEHVPAGPPEDLAKDE